MLHEIVELVKALAWPLVVLFVVFKFGPEIRSLLSEIPSFSRRVRTADLLGAKIELEALGHDLSLAQKEAPRLALPPGEVPLRNEGGSTE
jgi:hypothetical protein